LLWDWFNPVLVADSAKLGKGEILQRYRNLTVHPPYCCVYFQPVGYESAAANAHEPAQHCDGAGVQCLAVPGHLMSQAQSRRFALPQGIYGAQLLFFVSEQIKDIIIIEVEGAD
jgi:hypothetical protein